MINLKQKTFRLLICVLMLCFLMISTTWGDVLLRYSKDDPKIKEMIVGVSERPGGYSLTVAENIVGRWKAMPIASKSLARNLNVTWQSLCFQTNGVVKISYELTSEGKARQFVGSYEIIHKATEGRGNPPNIVIRSRNIHDENLNVLVHVRIGEFNFFPSDIPVLWFQDPDGYHYSFEPVGASAEHRLKLLGRVSIKEQQALRKQTEALRVKKVRITDSELTQKICAKFRERKLSEPERNKAILRLMNEGDNSCVPFLIKYLSDDQPLVIRQNAIRALGKIGDNRAVASLLDILEKPIKGDLKDEGDDEAIIRRSAVLALGEIADVSALSMLMRIVKATHEYQSVREFAQTAVLKIEKK